MSAGGGTLIPGADLLAGEGVSTPTQEGRASVVFPDGTLFKLDGLTTVTSIKASPSKRARLEKGLLIVSVPRQPAGKPAVITTPHAEVEIQGATLTFHVAPDSTRLEVVDGNVQLTRIADRKSVVVGAGKRAVVAPGKPLVEE